MKTAPQNRFEISFNLKIITFAFESLADESEEHFAAKVAKGRCFVRVNVELMRPDLDAILRDVGCKQKNKILLIFVQQNGGKHELL